MCNYDILRKQEAKDGTKKYLFDVGDGNAIETVLMSYHHGYSICVSSQIGCKMGCKFCASTGINFIRSLSSGEIVEQIIAVEQDENIRISNVVFMGIGEPLNNYNNVVNSSDIASYFDKYINVIGMIDTIKIVETKKLETMAFISLQDEFGVMQVTIFPKEYPKIKNINKNDIVFINGKVQRRMNSYQVILQNIKKL